MRASSQEQTRLAGDNACLRRDYTLVPKLRPKGSVTGEAEGRFTLVIPAFLYIPGATS
jgi:hypothetical protein